MVARKMQSSGAISFNDIRTRLLDNDSAGGISLYGADSDGGLARQTLFDSAGGFNTAISLDDYYGAYPFPDHCLTLDLPDSVKDSAASGSFADRINTPLNIQCDNTEGVGFNFAIYFSWVLRTNTNHPSYNEVHIYKETTSGNFSELLVIDAARLLSDTGRNVYFPSTKFEHTHVFNRDGTRLAIIIYEQGSTTASGDDEGGFIVYKRSGSTWTYADHILRGHADFSYLSAGDDVEPISIVSSGNSGYGDFLNIVVNYGYDGIELYFVQSSNGVISPATDLYPASQVQADYGGLHQITRKGEDASFFYMRDPITPFGIGRVQYTDLSIFENKHVLMSGSTPVFRSMPKFQNFSKYTCFTNGWTSDGSMEPKIELYLNTTSSPTLMYRKNASPEAMSSMPNWLADRSGGYLSEYYTNNFTAMVANNEAFMVCVVNITSASYGTYGPVMWFAQRNYARDGDVNNNNDSRFKQMYNLSSPISNVGQTGQSHYAFKNPPFNHFNSVGNVPFSQIHTYPAIAGGGEDGARFIIWVSSGSGQLQFFSLNQGGTTG